ncbi:MAG: hypothetical protein AB8B47_02750 [Roseobacter sp.]
MQCSLPPSLLAAVVATAAASNANAAPLAETLFSAQSLVFKAGFIRTMDAVDATLDDKEWSMKRAFHADTVDVDCTSFVLGGAR